jgi:ribosomal protein S18 acetylase RimI-like enzyme
VGEDNTPAVRLYTRAGFEQVSRRHGYYQDDAGRQTAALVLRCDFE